MAYMTFLVTMMEYSQSAGTTGLNSSHVSMLGSYYEHFWQAMCVGGEKGCQFIYSKYSMCTIVASEITLRKPSRCRVLCDGPKLFDKYLNWLPGDTKPLDGLLWSSSTCHLRHEESRSLSKLE
ncbi:hypothetical protein MPSEU_000147600 [Mayamaea pseudoterrestris]|nr:hypothetical protein MPSEU_000147600 [Mayamaea pseudoterrestris]